MATSQHAIALIQLDLGKREEAQKHLQQAIALREALVKDAPKNAQYQTDLALSRFALGDFSWRSGRLAEAAKAWQRSLEVLETAARKGRELSSLTSQLLAMRRAIAEHYGRAGLWSEAAVHYHQVISLEGAFYNEFYNVALLALLSGDADAYRRTCKTMAQRFGEAADIPHRGYLAWACCLAAPSGIETTQIRRWARVQAGINPIQERWLMHVLGLAHYRAGQFTEAIAKASKSNTHSAPWPTHIVNLPVLAMAHHGLGHAAEARQFLDKAQEEWRRLSPLMRSLGSMTDLPATSKFWHENWYDWSTFELLLHEASRLINGSPSVEEAYDRIHQSLLYLRLGENDKAEVQWQAAVQMVPREPALWLARGRAFAQLGQHDKADADFARAAALTPQELDRFPQAGWWVVGPYPEDLKLSCPPEKAPDPSRPVVVLGSATELHWRPAPTEPEGKVDLRAIFKADHISAYALTYVYSPAERTATLMVGGDDWVRVWLNGRLVHETNRIVGWPWDCDRVQVTLKAGRNTLLCKIGQEKGPLLLYLRIADNPLDRAMLHAQLGLWDEAAAEFARGIDLQPSANAQIYRFSSGARLVVGDTAGYRRCLARMFERYDKESYASFELAYAGGLLEGAVKAARLVELAERTLESGRLPYFLHASGMAYYRAGQFDKTIERLEESLKNPDWQSGGGRASELGIALAHHRLGHVEEARQWLDKAEQWYEKAIQDALASPTATASLLYWMDWPSFVVLRREAHKAILGIDLKDDPRLKQLADRMRNRLKKLDPATADYDVAILLSPNEPRLWQARGQRLTELKRTKEAEADFAKARTLLEGKKAESKKLP